jgi:hypothetical protein
MTIQQSFSFARNRKTTAGTNDADDKIIKETPADGDVKSSPRPGSLSPTLSNEKQTFGVAKVEAITTVWTKKSLITLYALYDSPFFSALMVAFFSYSLSIRCSNKPQGNFSLMSQAPSPCIR